MVAAAPKQFDPFENPKRVHLTSSMAYYHEQPFKDSANLVQKRHKNSHWKRPNQIVGSRVNNADLMSHGVASSHFFKSNNVHNKGGRITQKHSVDRAQIQSVLEAMAKRNVRTSCETRVKHSNN